MPYKQYYETDVTTRKSPQYQEETFEFYDDDYGYGMRRDGLAAQQQLKSYEAVNVKYDGEFEMIIPYHAVIKAQVMNEGFESPIAEDPMCISKFILSALEVSKDADGVLTPIELEPEFNPISLEYTGTTDGSKIRLSFTVGFEDGVDAELHIVYYHEGATTIIPSDNPEIEIDDTPQAANTIYMFITSVGGFDQSDPFNSQIIKSYHILVTHE